MRHLASLLVFQAVLLVIPASAQQAASRAPSQPDNAALLQKISDLEDRIVAMEGQIRQLKSQQPAAAVATGQSPPTATGESQAPPPSVAPAPVVAASESAIQGPALGGAGGSAAKALNPDISAIGDFIASTGHNPVNPTPSFEMHESELGFQAIIDPYSRGDFFLSFGEEGVTLEEGYITFTALPAGFVAKVGKFRSAFGMVNTMHNHVLPWVDRPLVTNNLVAGEDGIDDAGISVQRIIPVPKGIFMELTGQVFRGDSGDPQHPLYHATNNSQLSTVEHLRTYKDITESTNIDLGFSYSQGYSTLSPTLLTRLYGIDTMVRWKPLRRSIYHSFVGRGEFIWSQRQQIPVEQRAFGFYTSGDYQFARRWFAGARFDRSDEARNTHLLDQGVSAVLTYWPSEFAQIRGQYEFTRYGGNIDTHQLFMQVQFSLGAHGAHPF